MKEAIVFFKGEEVTRVEFDSVFKTLDVNMCVLHLIFTLKGNEVGFFNHEYCYAVKVAGSNPVVGDNNYIL